MERQDRMVSEANMQRVAQLISFGLPVNEVHDRLVADGMTEEDFFLCYAAGKRLAETAVVCDHGIPKKLSIHMSMSFFRPDFDRCPACKRADEEEQERSEAEMDAFCERLKARRAANG
jgi:hypothetical protein